jgi:acyl-CoA synthetase (AMP-forming)/AMP-acid ligase II
MHPLLKPELQATYRERGWWEDVTLAEIVAGQAARRPGKVAIDDGDVTLTFEDVDDYGKRLASGLAQAGVEPGTIVPIIHASGWQTSVAQVALSRLGAVAAPMSPKTTARRAGAAIEQFSPPAMIVEPVYFADPDWAALVDNCVARSSGPVVVTSGPAERAGVAEFGDLVTHGAVDDLRRCPNDIALLISTGGTTGPPKAVMQHDNAIVYSCRFYERRLGVTADDVMLGFGPYGHIITAGHMLYLTMLTGATLVPFPKWNARVAADVIERKGVTFSQLAPAALLDLFELPSGAEDQLRTLRIVSTGGRPSHFFADFRKRFGTRICRTYGMTEAPGHTMVDAERFDETDDIDGGPAEGTEVRLVDPRTRAAVPDGVAGEALVRGPDLFLGYRDRPDLTAAVVDEDGFLNTGDLVVRQGDTLKIVGRSKDVIRRGSVNIDPLEIETLLTDHPAVNEAIAIGIPDPRLEERILAVIVPKEGASVDLGELLTFLRAAGLPANHLPEGLDVVDSLPLTELGKYDKVRAREDAQARRGGLASPGS